MGRKQVRIQPAFFKKFLQEAAPNQWYNLVLKNNAVLNVQVVDNSWPELYLRDAILRKHRIHFQEIEEIIVDQP